MLEIIPDISQKMCQNHSLFSCLQDIYLNESGTSPFRLKIKEEVCTCEYSFGIGLLGLVCCTKLYLVG